MLGTNLLQEKKLNTQRGVESYDFESDNYDQNKKRISGGSKGCDLKNVPKNHLFATSGLVKPPQPAQKTESIENKGSLKDRLGSRVSYDETKSRSHIKATDLDSDDLVAKEITKHLREPKDDIIRKK
jgi:hypothetical protein